MPGAGFEIRLADGVPVVSAPAEIDVTNAGRLGQAIRSCADAGHTTQVVDMSETTFCDSAGLEQLVQAHRQAVATGGELRLVIGTASVMRILALVGADRMMPIFTSLDDALEQEVPAPGPAV
jgi:anti-sigma B factor antagonist